MPRVGQVGAIARGRSRHVVGHNAVARWLELVVQVAHRNACVAGVALVALYVHIGHVVEVVAVVNGVPQIANLIVVKRKATHVVEVGTVVVGLRDLVATDGNARIE